MNPTVKAQIVSQIMAANLARRGAKLGAAARRHAIVRDLTGGGETLFNCHRFFMENPSLPGAGTAGAKDVPA